ncbi:hypothetical protein KAW64_13240 [bacterium]|nr:hypothetical protein [bacterium]
MTLRDHTTGRLRLVLTLGVTAAALAAALALSGCSSSNPAGPSLGQSYLVDLTGAGDFLTIQEGLNAASDGDTVLIAPGVYAGPGNKNLTFGGVSTVVRGLASRDETVIDCEGSGRGFYIGGGAAPVIEDLMVTNGDTIKGGGMYLEGTSPTLRNVRFVDNASIDGGGGLYCRNGSPALEDVLFDDNTADVQGGGMLCINSSASLIDVVFFRNAAQGSGGGMTCVFSSPSIAGTVFRRNSAGLGGALYCAASNPSITSCTMVENEGGMGSGIYCVDGAAPAIRHTIIAYGSPGEALYCDGSVPYTALSCIYANGELNELCGDYTTSILYVDPLFCDLADGDFTLCANSPCLPENNAWGIQIGAHGEGCGPCDTPVERTSWSSTKAMFR